MSRHSAHTARARAVTLDGDLTELGEISLDFNMDESQSPFGQATITCPILQDEALMTACDPRINRGLRLIFDVVESVGDPVIVSEITADYGGSVAAITAHYAPDITPARITADYFIPWNSDLLRGGSSIRGNLLITNRDVSHRDGTMTFEASTDEAAAQAYRLLSTVTQTSGSLSVRATVNYALSMIGAALQPGIDATIAETDAIVWAPGVSAWDYMQNVAEASGLVVRCDESRNWTLTEREATINRTITFNRFTEAREAITLDDNLWADAVVVKWEWVDPTTLANRVRYDIATDIENPVKVILVERTQPFPGPGAAQYWLARFRSRGRVYDVEQVSDYSIRPGMKFTADVPYTPTQTGYIESVTWRLPDDELTVRTRGSADTILDAIARFPDGVMIDDLVGMISTLTPIGY